MQSSLTIDPITRINGKVDLPGSKSISNRALLLAAQASGITYLNNLLDSEDVQYMLTALAKLGVNYHLSPDRRSCKVHGLCGPLGMNKILTIFLGNSGTSMRSLTASLCLKANNIILTGETRMKERPIGHLIDALRQGGAKIDYLEQKNYPPIKLYGNYQGGNIIINSSVSSQFLTALLMMAPLAPKDSHIYIKSQLVSKPYIDITLKLMKTFGIEIWHDNYQSFYIAGNRSYRSPGTYQIEGDASSASYFLAAAAIRGGTVSVTGIGRNSLQGDIYFANVLENMGAHILWGNDYIECTRGKSLIAIDMDMNHIPDAAMTVATTALFTSKGNTTIRNIYNWRVKETDRLTAMAIELRKVGANVIEGDDFLTIKAPSNFKSTCINTYNDHRIAMCFALVALSGKPVTIINPKCTHKTFPNFFKQFAALSI